MVNMFLIIKEALKKTIMAFDDGSITLMTSAQLKIKNP